MVGPAGSPTCTVYADVTLTRSKIKVTGLLNFRQLAKPCMLAAMTAAPLRGFLVLIVFVWSNKMLPLRIFICVINYCEYCDYFECNVASFYYSY